MNGWLFMLLLPLLLPRHNKRVITETISEFITAVLFGSKLASAAQSHESHSCNNDSLFTPQKTTSNNHLLLLLFHLSPLWPQLVEQISSQSVQTGWLNGWLTKRCRFKVSILKLIYFIKLIIAAPPPHPPPPPRQFDLGQSG